MKIRYLEQMPETYASIRYRMRIPGEVLQRMGHDVSWHDAAASVPINARDVLVTSKYHYQDNTKATIVQAKAVGARVVYDIADDHSQSPLPIWPFYQHIKDMVDEFTVPTERMREVVRAALQRNATVIPDPYEYDEAPPRFAPGAVPRLLWYGHPNNLPALLAQIPNLRDYRTTVLTCTEKDKDIPPLQFRVWSKTAMLEEFAGADIVVLPVDLSTQKKQAKSANRMVEAIRQGRFVVASPLPAYEPFGEWMWLGESLREGVEWAQAHPGEVLERIGKAQAYVREHFSPDVIAAKWLEVFTA